jgi:ankyrin repeat protein
MSMTFFDRLPAWFVNLRYFVPAYIVFAAATLLQHPAVIAPLLIGATLMVAGICQASGLVGENRFAATVFRRASLFFAELVLYAAVVALLVAYPLGWLLRDQSLSATLAVSTEVVVALLCLWRIWPAFGLVFLWNRSLSSRSAGAPTLPACARYAHQMSGQNELLFSHGIVVAFNVFLLAVGAMAIGALYASLPRANWLGAVAVYALLVAPVAATVIANRCASALLIELRRQRRERAEAAIAPEPAPEQSAAPVVEAAAQLDQPDLNARLLRCARAGQTELALAAIAHGADPHAVPAPNERDQRSVLVLATLGGDMRLLRSLIAKGADLNRAHAGLAPLIAATRDSHQGRPDAVMTLLTNGADPRCVDAAGNTPLHYAALSATPIVAALLCDAAAPIEAVNRDGLTALGMAAAAGNRDLVRFLLDRGAKAEPERAQPAMLSAAGVADDDPAVIELLLKRKARVDVHDALGRTALMVAALQANTAIAEVLIDVGAQVGLADSRGTTALMEAARSGADEVLELLAARDSAPDAVDAMGRSALIIACQSRQSGEATIRMLLAAGAARDLLTADGKRAVDFAAAAGRWNIVALLDADFPLPASLAGSAQTGSGDPSSSLHLLDALRFGHWNIVETFAVRARAWPADELTRLYLELADHDSAEPRSWLLAHGLQQQAADAAGTGLLLALLARLPESADALAQWHAAGASPSGTDAIVRVTAALAAERAPRAMLEALALAMLDGGADPFRADGEGRTPLAHAVAAGSATIAGVLLARGVDPNTRDRQGRSPLCEALGLPGTQAEALIRLLIHAGANPDVPAVNGETPLGIALARPDLELRRWLNWSRWKPPQRALREGDLPAAAAVGDVEAVGKLLDLGLPIDAVDAQGADALLRAAGGGHAQLVARLIERGADPLRAAPSGATPLSAAVTARRADVVVVLLGRGVPVDSRLPTGGTPLMIAAALGFPEIIDRLLTCGAQANARDERSTTALHAAAQFAFRSSETESARRVVEQLLEHGAEINATNATGQTPLLLLLGGRADPGDGVDQKHLTALLPLFLLARADLNLQDQRGVGPLHACAMHGLLLPARALLAARADPLRRDMLDRTPRQVAQLLGYIDLAAELGAREPAPQPVSSEAT